MILWRRQKNYKKGIAHLTAWPNNGAELPRTRNRRTYSKKYCQPVLRVSTIPTEN
jgi:hypothetical protein